MFRTLTLCSYRKPRPSAAWAEYDKQDVISDVVPLERVTCQEVVIMASWTQEVERGDSSEVVEHEEEYEEELSDNEILNSFFSVRGSK